MAEWGIYAYSLLTVAVFALAVCIAKYWKSVIFNSFVLSVLLLIAIIVGLDLPYESYRQGNAPLSSLLSVGVVALALPLYEQLPQIRKQWREILLVTTTASVFSMLSGAALAVFFGATPDIVASMLPKSVTTPIAMAIADSLGGSPVLAAMGVVMAGLQGSIFGYLVMKMLKIRYAESMGLAIGAASHALGTASVMQENLKAGSYSSLSLVLCGIISSLLAPLVFKLVYCFF